MSNDTITNGDLNEKVINESNPPTKEVTAKEVTADINKPAQSLPKKKPTLNDIFKFENNKVILKETKNEFEEGAKGKIIKLLNFINKQGIYDIKINLENVVKKLKLNQFNHTKRYSVDGLKKTIIKSSPFLLISGLIVIIDEQNIVHLALPKFFLDRDTFEESFEEFMDIIPNANSFNQLINMARPYIKKLFIRINRDGNGKAIFSNILDSLIKLGLTFSLIVHRNVRGKDEAKLIPYLEYFSNFVIENITTMVSDKCRSKTLEKDLFDNDMICKVPKLEENCPVCNCSECPVCNCSECPVCDCSECEKCPEQSNNNLYIAGGIISVLVIVIIFLLIKK